MTSKSGFFVFILIASGCLSKACGDGEISTSPRSFEAAPTPDQPDVARPAGPLGDPYVYATLADVGVTIGPGVIAPYPTEAYTGPCTITADDTTIENKVVNCDVLRIDGNNLTIRNSVVNITNTGSEGIRLGYTDRNLTGLTIEYSHIDYPNPNGKLLNAFIPLDGSDDTFTNLTFRYSHIEGGYDWFNMEGNLDGSVWEYNVIGPLASQEVSQHCDGFQLWKVRGSIIIRGNQILTETPAGKTAFFNYAGGDLDAIIESNNLPIFGATTLWATDNDDRGSMQVRYNVYTPEWEAAVGNRGGSGCGSQGQPESCGYPIWAANWRVGPASRSVAECNRYESDGSFVEDQYFDGVTHNITGCPDYP